MARMKKVALSDPELARQTIQDLVKLKGLSGN